MKNLKKYLILAFAALLLLMPFLAFCQFTSTQNTSKHPLSFLKGYQVTPKKLAVWSASLTLGLTSAFHAEPDCFEKTFGVDPYSFWGSRQWERNYITNRYINPVTGLPNRHKSEILGNFGRDFWHTSRFVVYGGGIATTFTIGTGKQNFKHKLFDILISSAFFTVGSNVSYNLLRRA